ncbi:MAG: hypothetical protein WCB49_12700 [Gammaproteobacteria bacterium]
MTISIFFRAIKKLSLKTHVPSHLGSCALTSRNPKYSGLYANVNSFFRLLEKAGRRAAPGLYSKFIHLLATCVEALALTPFGAYKYSPFPGRSNLFKNLPAMIELLPSPPQKIFLDTA